MPQRSGGELPGMNELEEERLTALVIKEPYISEILAGRKTWELRSRKTQRRGLIGLIGKGSGHVVGTALLVDVLPEQSEADLLGNVEKHRVEPELIRSGAIQGWRIPWVLRDARPLPKPVPYAHPAGAVIWVTLSSDESRSVLAQLSDARPDTPQRRLEQPQSTPTAESAISGRGELMVPVARDGTWFGPHLQRQKGTFQIGEKGDERIVAGFEEALKQLQQMRVAKWRRPNPKGNWGIVSAVEWLPLAEVESRER